MDKQQVQSKQTMIQASIVSIIYAALLQVTEGLTITPNSGATLNVAIFVPIIAAIIFGKNVGGGSAAGGQLVSMAGTSLFGAGDLAIADLGNIITLLADLVGVYTVGILTNRPEGDITNLTERFTSKDTWKQIANNTIGSMVGVALGGSFFSSYASAIAEGQALTTGSATFVEQFFLNGLLIILTVPPAMLLYELGDAFADIRTLRIDQTLRRLVYMTPAEKVATVVGVRLPERAYTKDVWTPMKVKFRNKLNVPQAFNIESVSTARCYPHHDSTKVLKPGELWEQSFFILPAKQPSVDTRIRISPKQTSLADRPAEDDHTIIEVSGKSHDPSKNTISLIIFSVANFIMVGASIVWSNLMSMVGNLDAAFETLQSSWSMLVLTGGIEVALFVPLLYLMRRSILKGVPSLNLRLAFGTDISTHRYIDRVEDQLTTFIDYFRTKVEVVVQVILVSATLVSVTVLGIEGWNIFTDPSYTGRYPSEFFALGLIVLFTWIIGLKGRELLLEAGLIEGEKHKIEGEGAVQEISPVGKFQQGLPNEVVITARNDLPFTGIRLALTGFDTISPPLLELQIPPGGTSSFKCVITPIDVGTRDLLAIAYPLFDKEGNYIDSNEAEPYSHQRISYEVMTATQLGITQEQQSKLKKLGVVVLALASLVYGSSFFLQGFFDDISTMDLIRDNAPYLLALQAPFVYAYFYFQNKFKTMNFDAQSLLDKLSASQGLANDLDKSVGSEIGDKIGQNVQDTVKSQISSQIRGILGDEVSGKIESLVKSQVTASLGTGVRDQLMSSVETEVKDKIGSEVVGQLQDELGDELSPQIRDLVEQFKTETGVEVSEQDLLTGEARGELKKKVAGQLEGQVRAQAKERAKAIVRTEILPRISQDLGKEVGEKIKKTIRKELSSKLEKQLLAEVDKLVAEGLTEQVLEELESKLDNDLREQLMAKIEEQTSDRRITQRLAEELDDKLGSDLSVQFENAIGTQLESEIGGQIKQKLTEKFQDEIQGKLKKRLQKEVDQQIKKQSRRLVKRIVEEELEGRVDLVIERSIGLLDDESIERLLGSSIDGVVDKLIDLELAKALI